MAELVSHAPFELAWRCFAQARGKKKGVIISVRSMHSREKVCFMAFGAEDNFPARRKQIRSKRQRSACIPDRGVCFMACGVRDNLRTAREEISCARQEKIRSKHQRAFPGGGLLYGI